jgi:hypothetical protein
MDAGRGIYLDGKDSRDSSTCVESPSLVFKRNRLKYCFLGLVGKRNLPSHFGRKTEEWLAVAQTPLTYESFLGHAQEFGRLHSKLINKKHPRHDHRQAIKG